MEKAWELVARKNLKERQVGKGHRRPGRNKVIGTFRGKKLGGYVRTERAWRLLGY